MADLFYENDIVEYLRDLSFDVYENVPVYEDDEFKIRLAVVIPDGTFLIIPKRENFREDIKTIQRKFYIGQYNYIFLTGISSAYFFDGNNVIPVDDLFLSFRGLFEAVSAGQFSIKPHITSDNDYKLDEILELKVDVFEEKEHSPIYSKDNIKVIKTAFQLALTDNEEHKMNIFTRRVEKQVDGQTYIRYVNTWGKEEWCLVDESVDPDEHARTAAFFGFLGIHKFSEGKIGSGLLYIFCLFGCFGIMPALDVLAMISGTYRLKNGDYLSRIKDVKKALLNLIVTAVVGVALFFGSRYAMSNLSYFISNQAVDYISSETEGMSEDELTEYLTELFSQFGYTDEEIEEYLDNLTDDEIEEYFNSLENE